MYSELNYLWESWLKIKTDNSTEAIQNKSQGKGFDEYQLLMTGCFREYYRVLKPGRWMTVEFSNTNAAIWNGIQTALQRAGFVVANVAAWGLGVAAVTRPLESFVNGRSVGIKDLRFGAIVEDDWRGIDPDALLHNAVGEHSLAPGIDHHFVAGVVTSNPTHPVGVAVGDLIVRSASGTGGGHLEPENAVVVGGKNHFELLNEPEVLDCVMGWLARPTPNSRNRSRG